MYENLKGKKLLVIGSEEPETNIVNAAHEMGVYVIACDGKKKSEGTFAKNIADESWDIDYSKTETIINKCKENGVDGVLAGYSDNRVFEAAKIADLLGTPFYASRELIELTRNKRKFKDECVKYGLKTPKDYCVDADLTGSKLEAIRYPVIVKPADNGGRKGITICDDLNDLQVGMENALSLSESKTVIVEEYVEGIEFVAIYTLSDGKAVLSCFNEKYLNDNKKRKSLLCDLAITSTAYLRDFGETDKKIQEMLSGIGAKDGVASFQGIIAKDGFWVFELGYRLNGGNDYFFIERENGISYMKMLISYSLTGSMQDDVNKNNPNFKQYHANYLLYAGSGTVGEIAYNGIVGKNGIDDIHISLHTGKYIDNSGTTGQKAFSFKISAASKADMIDKIDYIYDHTVLRDVKGNNMFLNPFDTDRLLE